MLNNHPLNLLRLILIINSSRLNLLGFKSSNSICVLSAHGFIIKACETRLLLNIRMVRDLQYTLIKHQISARQFSLLI
jgi:hypothetical protein